MKIIYNIAPNIKKILIMLLLVVFLAACGNGEDASPREICSSAEDAKGTNCIDVKDVDCLGCRVFTLMFNAVSVNIMKLHGQLTTGALPLMMICFSIWLAVRLLKFVSSLSDSSIAQFWNDVLKQGFLCVFCGLLASSPDMLVYAVNTFIYPVYAAFLKLGLAIMETAITNTDGTAATIKVYGETITMGKTTLICTFDKTGLITKNGFPQEFLNAIICMIAILKEYLSIGGDISSTMMMQSGNIVGWLAGFFLWAFFTFTRLGFVFYLVNNIFQMGIMILLLPIFILAYPFNMTRKWLTDCFQNLLSSAGFLMCFSIVVMMVLRSMVELIVNNPKLFSPERPEFDFANLGVGCICLLLIGALVYGSIGVAEAITSSLVGGGLDKKFQENMTQMLGKAKGWIMSGLSSMATFGMSIMPAGVQKFASNIKAARNKVDRLAGRK